MKQLPVRMDDELHERVRTEAYLQSTSMNQVVIYALLEYFDRLDSGGKADGHAE